ncbi:hypothetical protein [Micromonospora endolithica]|uniref:Uncharacterized protein n=1 Tax=Micromonospora endolithica TaxID=230091 RepID=A0A3A9ZIA2_9ACTN|nr:hypothetical protein [Micromonospora endolithica]RKN47805.1 hypothetical protein D7223_13765 [Micromonospora endolithica]TWJ21488.1 hypothetical protein JD76_01598 [Micromonospora endolithica]
MRKSIRVAITLAAAATALTAVGGAAYAQADPDPVVQIVTERETPTGCPERAEPTATVVAP